MRRHGAAAVVVLTLVAGCASSSGGGATKAASTSGPSPSASASAPAPQPPTAADVALGTSLVRVGDLPTGYVKDAVARGTSLAVSKTDSVCAHRFAALNALRTRGALASVARARVSFSRGSAGPFVRATAIRFHNAGAATKVLSSIDTTFRNCRGFTATNPTTKRLTNVTLAPLSFPHLGDQGVAIGGRLVAGGKTGVDIDLVAVRKGASLAYVAEIATAGVDVAALEQAVRAEVARLPKA